MGEDWELASPLHLGSCCFIMQVFFMHIKQTHNEISHMNNGFNQVLNTIQVPFSLPVQL